MDVVFINPNSSAKAYQDLALTYSAIEPPTWALLLAQACLCFLLIVSFPVAQPHQNFLMWFIPSLS